MKHGPFSDEEKRGLERMIFGIEPTDSQRQDLVSTDYEVMAGTMNGSLLLLRLRFRQLCRVVVCSMRGHNYQPDNGRSQHGSVQAYKSKRNLSAGSLVEAADVETVAWEKCHRCGDIREAK